MKFTSNNGSDPNASHWEGSLWTPETSIDLKKVVRVLNRLAVLKKERAAKLEKRIARRRASLQIKTLAVQQAIDKGVVSLIDQSNLQKRLSEVGLQVSGGGMLPNFTDLTPGKNIGWSFVADDNEIEDYFKTYRVETTDFDREFESYFFSRTITSSEIRALEANTKDLLFLLNYLDGFIKKIILSTKEGLYQIAPLTISIFHYMDNIFTIEKFIGLSELTLISNSLNFLKCRKHLCPIQSLTLKR